MAYDVGLGDDDMNRGSSQTGVCYGERRSPDARADGWRVCDKRSETGRREGAREGGREGAKGGGRRGGGQGWAN
jgi:hypothetical protein